MVHNKISYRETALPECNHIAAGSEDFVKNVLRKRYNRFILYIHTVLTEVALLDQ